MTRVDGYVVVGCNFPTVFSYFAYFIGLDVYFIND